MVKVPAMQCISYELEISREKISAAILKLVKSMKISTLKILGYPVNLHVSFQNLKIRHFAH